MITKKLVIEILEIPNGVVATLSELDYGTLTEEAATIPEAIKQIAESMAIQDGYKKLEGE